MPKIETAPTPETAPTHEVRTLTFASPGGFLTPRVFIVLQDGTKKEAKENALQFGYLALFASIGKPDSASDVTKSSAGILLQSVVNACPVTSKFEVYLPSRVEYRYTEDMAQWELIGTFSQAEIKRSCDILADSYKVLAPALLEVKRIAGVLFDKDGAELAPALQTKIMPERKFSLPIYPIKAGKVAKKNGGTKSVSFESMFG